MYASEIESVRSVGFNLPQWRSDNNVTGVWDLEEGFGVS
jgi:hypothetical protein